MNLWAWLILIEGWQSFANADFVYDLVRVQDTIYSATNGGLAQFSIPDSKWVRVFTNTDGLEELRLRALAVDGKGNLWMGRDGGLSIKAQGRISNYPPHLFSSEVQALAVAGDTLLVGTPEGLYLIATNWTPQPEPGEAPEMVLREPIHSLGVGADIWVGTGDGLIRLVARNPDSLKEFPIRGPVTAIGVAHDRVYFATPRRVMSWQGRFDTLIVFKDTVTVRDLLIRPDTLYLATRKGLFCLKGGALVELFPVYPEPGWKEDIRALLWADGLWFGVGIPWAQDLFGYGLYRYEGPGRHRSFPTNTPFSNHISSLLATPSGEIWVCHKRFWHETGVSHRSRDGKWERVGRKRIPNAPNTKVLAQDSRGWIWFGCWSAHDTAVVGYNPKDSSVRYYGWEGNPYFNVISAIGVDPKDRVWAFHFNHERITIHDSLAHPIGEIYLPGIYRGTEFAFDKDCRAWLASQEGLVLIHPDSGLLRTFTTSDGLPSSRVSSVAIDPRGWVWVGTDQGLARWDGESFRLYSPDQVVKVRADGWGRIWVLGPQDLKRFCPSTGRWEEYLPGPRSLVPAQLYTDLYLDPSQGYLLVGSGGGLSRFDYHEGQPAPSPDSVEVYPNPFIFGLHHRITIGRLPLGARVELYTLAGELIGPAQHIPEKGLAYLDPPTNISSGLYLIFISSPAGDRVVRLVVVR